MSSKFGHVIITSSCIFCRSALSYAFVNKKPIAPGHVLVASDREAKRFNDLSPEEVSDLFKLVHRISPIIQKVFNATALTIAIQDGAAAGQTVEHVHVHIVPRIEGDPLQDDRIYEVLQTHEKKDDIKWRTDNEMETEATLLKEYFEENDDEYQQ
ncbi:bis(5'-adenosyl)-triphosphatase-like [Symsagittifera roscoffensis]|uniref:bis(5'-adenosyl)-triphosphatase-like n=1 Tax=Symsagittifera roscoffensis TaxID=84072 RepID=UPI00307C350E